MKNQLSLFDETEGNNKNSIYYTHPDLMREWDSEKNNKIGLDPKEISYGSKKKAWWICKNGHSYYSAISNRTKGSGCAICKNKKVLAGYNDLATTKPKLLELWNYEKNDQLGLYPTNFTEISGKKVWWKCEKGHEWFATIAHISYGRGCPVCNCGKQTSFPEQAIYYYLKKIDSTCINRFKINGKKEIDIFIPSLNVGIEYNGYKWHEGKEMKDFFKSMYYMEKGINIVRIEEENRRISQLEDGEVLSFNEWTYLIKDEDYKALAELIRVLVKMFYKKEINIDLDKDRSKIYRNYLQSEVQGSIVNNEKIMKFFDYEKNMGVKPEYISRSSGKKLWWKCEKGHSFLESVHAMDQGRYCPVCRKEMAQKIGLIPLNERYLKTLKFSDKLKSLKLASPELSKEWNYEKNYPVRPENIVSTSKKKYWWTCSKCGYEWQQAPLVRIKGSGCRKCGYKLISESKYKKVDQYTKEGKYINTFNSIKEANEFCGSGHVGDVCRGTRRYAGGYIWKWH